MRFVLLGWVFASLTALAGDVTEGGQSEESVEVYGGGAPSAPDPVLYEEPVAEEVVAETRNTFEADIDPRLQLMRKVTPLYPTPLHALHGDAWIACKVWVRVNGKGTPKRAAALDCPDGFHLAAIDAVQQWRWYALPNPDDEADTLVEVTFREVKRGFTPGFSFFPEPAEVTADPALPALIRTGNMPGFPTAVAGGRGTCRIMLTVAKSGASKNITADGCAPPYKKASIASAKSWKWYPAFTSDGKRGEADMVVHVSFQK